MLNQEKMQFRRQNASGKEDEMRGERMKREERVCCRKTQRVGGGIVEGCISLERNLRAHRSLLYNNRGSSILTLYISVLQFLFFLLSRLLVRATTEACLP